MNNIVELSKETKYKIISGAKQLKFFNKISELRKQVWPNFIRLPDDIVFKLYKLYPEFQISLLAPNKELIGVLNSIPITWTKSLSELPNEGVNWVINTGINGNPDTEKANIVCAVSVTVADNYRNRGISKILLQHLKEISFNKKFTYLIVPARPSLKSLYPLTSIDKYITWKNRNGEIFDPWLRTHIDLGAQILSICYYSAYISADIKQWEQWTEMSFLDDGAYIVKGALVPVEIDCKSNLGKYIEPNIWVYYSL
ncbi:GNAT family N-acetyltransferase [Legionella sp. CNM-1927-20]|uniref:GNAT family N-acetyltransferase n=1 Tax=Legionella sp. CNM-1927-20 TaxID=3422221 RepID=UPI00403B2F0E